MKRLFLFSILVVTTGLAVGWFMSRTSVPEVNSVVRQPPVNLEWVSTAAFPAPPPRFRNQRADRETRKALPPVQQREPPQDPDEIRQWVRENPAQALAWMMNAPAGPQRDAAAEIACAQVAEMDPARAVELAEHYAGGCTNLLENLVYQWSERNEPEARAYALKKPAGEERDRLLARVALSRARTDPEQAAKFVVSEMSPGETQNEAVMSVLHQWTLREPDQALAWAQLFPESSLRYRALMEIENLRQHSGRGAGAGTGM